MIFPRHPQGLILLGRKEHELPLPVVWWTRLRICYVILCLWHHFSNVKYIL